MRHRRLPALAAIMLAAPAAPAQPESDGTLVLPGVAVFVAPEVERAGLEPSVALLAPLPEGEDLPATFGVSPRFHSTLSGLRAVRIPTEAGTSLYGTGEAPGQLLRNGRVIDCWNFDAYGYGDDAPHLYQSHPWVLAVRADGTSFGVFADTTHRVTIDLTDGIEFVSRGPDFAVVVIEREHPAEVVTTLAELTGRIEMPPLWALGYHQCRYSYFPDDRVREIAEGFRERAIPADVIWMDIDYMDGFRVFTFDPEGFPDPASLNDDLHEMDFRSVWMLDPGVKKDPGYAVYDSGTERDVWVKTRAGETYVGEVWPGDCVFPDYTNAGVRSWWSALCAEFVAMGVDGIWNDMNEPAVFGVESKTMPLDNVHRADPVLGGEGTHAKYHNVYGMQMVRATREGVLDARPELRPFVLSRANYLGGQRYAATWSGDNTADWYHLESSIPMVINLGLSASPFTGPDIGGFAGDGDAAMFARWMGVGTLLPFARGHTGKGNIDKEPWSFGPEVEATCRRALERRYRLLPYIYGLFREAHLTGMPVVRPLFFADPADPALRSEDDAFLLGGDVLVVASLSPGHDRAPALPSGFEAGWVPFDLDDSGDPDLPALYLRRGAILPLGPVIQHTGEYTLDELTLLVAPDARGGAAGELYEDDGETFGFRDGAYRLTRFTASDVGGSIRLQATQTGGAWPAAERTINVRVIGAD